MPPKQLKDSQSRLNYFCRAPQTLLLAKNMFQEFFIAKSIADKEKVKLILGVFKDMHIRDWIATDCVCLLGLIFDDFMSELCTNFLPSDWVESIQISLLRMRMMKNVKFWDYAQEVHALNIVLWGTPSHLGESTLCNQLEAGLELSLQTECQGRVTILCCPPHSLYRLHWTPVDSHLKYIYLGRIHWTGLQWSPVQSSPLKSSQVKSSHYYGIYI